MTGREPGQCCLSEHRETVERLRCETAAELGAEPMQPEKFSMIAVAVASLPLVALMLPTIPGQPQVWQIAFAELAVWLAAFRIQSARYERFHARWRLKIAAHGAEPAPAPYASPMKSPAV